MKLSALLAQEFESTTKFRGRQYYLNGQVRLVKGGPTQVEAAVRGSRSYAVSLRYQDRMLEGECECPRFDEAGECKHIWAVILAAEDQGYLNGLPAGKIAYTPIFPEDFDYDYLAAEGEEDEDPHTLSELFPGEPADRRLLHAVPPPEPAWKRQLAEIRASASLRAGRGAWPANRRVIYSFDSAGSTVKGGLIVAVMVQDRKQNGEWTKPKNVNLASAQVPLLPDAEDRAILGQLTGAVRGSGSYFALEDYPGNSATEFRVSQHLAKAVVSEICRTGRGFLKTTMGMHVLRWDGEGAWELELELSKAKRGWMVTGWLRRGDSRMSIREPVLVLEEGLVFTEDRAAELNTNGSRGWVGFLRRGGIIEAFSGQEDKLLKELLADPRLPKLVVPEELKYERVSTKPHPMLKVERGREGYALREKRLRASLIFDYDKARVEYGVPSAGVFDEDRRILFSRDPEAESAAADILHGMGLKFIEDDQPHWVVPPTKLPKLVRQVVPRGWTVEAEGKLVRRAQSHQLQVTSGVDWFELHGDVDFGGEQASLPQLLKAVRRGDTMIRLGDGSFGMLPEEWLSRLGALPEYGTEEETHIRFGKNQVGLLDALLAAQPEIEYDKAFAKARAELVNFGGVVRAEQPEGFQGELRGYQKDGLGWMDFLARFGFGGCLADDMGVGKTAQVLALLEAHRAARAAAGEKGMPSLVVVPRSLVFNWQQEAARFTPRLRVLDYTGLHRTMERFEDYDLIVTTYGTLRRDAADFKDPRFNYVILDEAQAIKNASTDNAKAARLLQADHRLALSGTPVENHLGELWSLFEFLNPGMLGGAAALRTAGTATRQMEPEARELLAKALRPFILRRTKEQVVSELPPKVEQTLVCELEPEQRKLYDELREHYRRSLLKRISEAGLKRSKIQVLEALLRLRQAACHPGLIDAKRRSESSAKLELLQLQLADILQEGRKAIIFSQFTSFLSIVRARLNVEKIPYEYLDGSTVDRQACVDRFQSDPECRLFLISLKAGGLGLNLTAAEYVFLLDPWWNPAVEAQAIDRAHRIGQDKKVFAYRLISKDTVEEKILELQRTKRDLADAIIGADNSVIGNLGREDLELLLS